MDIFVQEEQHRTHLWRKKNWERLKGEEGGGVDQVCRSTHIMTIVLVARSTLHKGEKEGRLGKG